MLNALLFHDEVSGTAVVELELSCVLLPPY